VGLGEVDPGAPPHHLGRIDLPHEVHLPDPTAVVASAVATAAVVVIIVIIVIGLSAVRELGTVAELLPVPVPQE
jgi:hypothetical protein